MDRMCPLGSNTVCRSQCMWWVDGDCAVAKIAKWLWVCEGLDKLDDKGE